MPSTTASIDEGTDDIADAGNDVDPTEDGLREEGWGAEDGVAPIPADNDPDAADDVPTDDEKALDELAAEELEMLTEDEAAEVLIIDEAAEMQAIRRAEVALSTSGEDKAPDEFLCTNCFLLKKSTQLADKRRQLCNDCV
jgi:hypothetical protein